MPAPAVVRLIVVAAFVLLPLSSGVHADGVMSLPERELFRRGPTARNYCGAGASQDECDRALTKVLSGYGYLRGYVTGGVLAASTVRVQAAAHLSIASAALPGGELALGSIDSVVDDAELRRLRLAVFDGAGMFVCHDAQSGKTFMPIMGMFSHECRPDAVTGFDLGLVALHWNVPDGRLVDEWARFGPAFELLGNGLSYAHLLRSVVIALPLDLRSTLHGDLAQADAISVGAGLRVSALYRTPHWETRLELRHRSALVGGAGVRRDHAVQAELRLLHNFFLADAWVVQAGVSLRAAWARRPEDSFTIWAAGDRRWSGFAGFYFGWLGEPPNI